MLRTPLFRWVHPPTTTTTTTTTIGWVVGWVLGWVGGWVGWWVVGWVGVWLGGRVVVVEVVLVVGGGWMDGRMDSAVGPTCDGSATLTTRSEL